MQGSARTRSDTPSFWWLVALSTLTVLVAGAVLVGLSRWWGGPVVAAGYIALMFLAPAVRTLGLVDMIKATAWALVVCAGGVLIGAHGPWVLLVGVAVTALVQGLFVVGGSAGLNRSSASLVGFAAFAETSSVDELWQPLVGVLVGATAVTVLGIVAFGSSTKHNVPAPLAERLYYGVGLAAGSAVLTVLWTVFGWGGLGYALLVFCLIYAFDSGKVLHNSAIRVAGAALGVGVSVLAALILPTPLMIAAFVVCGILTLANLLSHHEFWYVVFMVAAVVHLAEVRPGGSAIDSGTEHIVGVIVAAIVAVALHAVTVPLHRLVIGAMDGPVAAR
ncbi:FUSC family protein [Gordonia sp. (in: high G+C Gram-positive bacteria)]|uniref:FUSC family protein n=1 Tax=Gordonia sp. (in: high G+C Gram-positive bacteria) TaxID=84139 RepID=UPI003C76A8FE